MLRKVEHMHILQASASEGVKAQHTQTSDHHEVNNDVCIMLQCTQNLVNVDVFVLVVLNTSLEAQIMKCRNANVTSHST